MSILLATRNDMDAIMAIIRNCIQDMESRGIFQWNEHYPTARDFEMDMQSKSLYAFKEKNDLFGIMTLNEIQSPEYNQLKWLVPNGKVLVIHRLAVDPKRQKQGIARQLMNFAENYAVEKRYDSIRLDAYTGNPRALELYERRGYQKTGEIFFPYRELAFNAYEKELIHIRRYQTGDFEQVWALHILAMQQVGAYKGDGPWDDDLRNIEQVYFDNHGEFLVGELGGRTVAMGAFKKSENNLAEVKRMRVHPYFQGHGYGRFVYHELEKRAKDGGYRGFHLETSELQIAAQKLYMQCGFKEVGRTMIDGFHCILYEKIF